MRHSLCPTCGHPVSVKLSVEKLGIILPPKQRRLFELVEKAGPAGMASSALFERIYADDPDGGPQTGSSIIAVMARHLNKKLEAVGLQVRNPGRAIGVYRLETITKQTGELT